MVQSGNFPDPQEDPKSGITNPKLKYGSPIGSAQGSGLAAINSSPEAVSKAGMISDVSSTSASKADLGPDSLAHFASPWHRNMSVANFHELIGPFCGVFMITALLFEAILGNLTFGSSQIGF